MSRETLHIMATTETAQASPENHPSPWDMELVPVRLPDNQARKERKAAVDLPRDKVEAVCEVMEPPEGDLSEEEDFLWERFGENVLNEFPKWKQKQEETIKVLRALADEVDAKHEKTSKINIVASSTAVLSGFLTLAGIALAPVTGGGSLILAAAGQGVGAAAGITSVVNNLLEKSHNKDVTAQANSLEDNSLAPTSEPEFQQVDGGKMAFLTGLTEIISKVGNTSQIVRKNMRAYQAALANPSLAKAAKDLIKGGQVSTQTSRHVAKAFEGTALAMTKNALLKTSGMATFCLVWDSYNLFQDWENLKDGKETDLAKHLRSWARELEEEVTRYRDSFEQLRQKLLKNRTEQNGLCSESATEPPTQPLSKAKESRIPGDRRGGAESQGL